MRQTSSGSIGFQAAGDGAPCITPGGGYDRSLMIAVTFDVQTLESSRWHRRRARETRAHTVTLIARALQLRQARTISGAADLRDVVKEKLLSGLLPLDEPITTNLGTGEGWCCAACGVPVSEQELQREADFETGETLRLHGLCFDVWSDERWRFVRWPHPIQGASELDTSTFVALLANVSLCIDCIAKKTGVPRDEAKTLLSRIRTSIHVPGETARCEVCLTQTTVFRLGGPAR